MQRNTTELDLENETNILIDSDNFDDNNKYNEFNFVLANARSLQSKIGSLIDLMSEMNVHAAALTETWFKNSKQAAHELEEIEDAEDIGLICRNRAGRRGGGVAVAFNKRKMDLKNFPLRNNKYEMVCAAGKSVDDTRKFAFFSLYIPPNQKAAKTREQMECLADGIEKAKLDLNDPYVVVAGDLNRRALDGIADFPDITVIDTAATRGDAVLDIVASNLVNTSARIMEPLEDEHGRRSDHNAVYVHAKLGRLHQYTTSHYDARIYTCLLYTSDAADE